MPDQRDNKNELLRRYLEQNGINSANYEQSVELDRLKMLYYSPDDFRRAVLEWGREQKEEQKRKEFLEEQQTERRKRLNSETSSGRIALAAGRQAQLENSELVRIKEMFEIMERNRYAERRMELERAQERAKIELERRRMEAQEQWTPPGPAPTYDMRRELEWFKENMKRLSGGDSGTLPPTPKPKEREIPMAPDTKKRRIILRD